MNLPFSLPRPLLLDHQDINRRGQNRPFGNGIMTNVGVLKAPEYRQGPSNRMGSTAVLTLRTQNAISISAVFRAINTVASETTLRRLALPAMQLYMGLYISPKGLTTDECY